MTGPEDSQSNTRPISVAELLAKNGTIGAPPIGGRRRRRRGDTDSITVAELTGEIPIVRDHDIDGPGTGRTGAAVVEEAVDALKTSNGAVEHVEDAATEAEGESLTAEDVSSEDVTSQDVAAEDVGAERIAAEDVAGEDVAEERVAEEDLDFFAPPRRSSPAPRPIDDAPEDGTVGAEQMSPDPVDWADLHAASKTAATSVDVAEPDTDHRDEPPSYLRSTDSMLFGGPTVVDDAPRRGAAPAPEDRGVADLEEDDEGAPAGAMSTLLHAAWVVGQCILAVAFGAGLFVAFDQLWNWNSIVALVLGVLVILGLVVGVRVVRKTEDIASTLIAVAVGALVTFGPLALMKA